MRRNVFQHVGSFSSWTINVANSRIILPLSNFHDLPPRRSSTQRKRISLYGNIYTESTLDTIDVETRMMTKFEGSSAELYMSTPRASAFPVFLCFPFHVSPRNTAMCNVSPYKSMRDTWMWHLPTYFESFRCSPFNETTQLFARAYFWTSEAVDSMMIVQFFGVSLCKTRNLEILPLFLKIFSSSFFLMLQLEC